MSPEQLRQKAAECTAKAERASNTAHHAGDYAPGSFVTGRSGRTRAMDKKTEQALDKTIKYSKIAAYWQRKAAAYEFRARAIENAPKLAEKKAKEKEYYRQAKKAKATRPIAERIGCGAYPCCFVWWDNGRERNGDYITLARMSYSTQILEFTKDCTNPEARRIIEAAAANDRIQLDKEKAEQERLFELEKIARQAWII